MLPTLRQLQYLKLLAEQGSFGRAAAAAHVTKPTLSAGIQELERALEAPVVDRARSGVILTAVGEEALRRAQLILTEAEELMQAAKNAGKPLTGRFRLGVIPTIAPYLLPKALPALRKRFPELRLFLREDLTQRLLNNLKAGQLDAALIALPFDTTGLAWAHVSDDELLAAAPQDHPWAKSAKVSGSGIFKDAASDALIRQYVFDGTIRDWQVVIPDFGAVEGPFQIAAFEVTGRHDGEVAFDLSLDSAGELTFTAA